MKKTIFNIALLFVFQISIAQTNKGSVDGIVIDAKSQEPLAGVNVLLRGTIRGTTTDAQGKYLLKQIPAGMYDLSFSLIGYTAQTINKITVQPDSVIRFNVLLAQAPIQTEQVVVTAGRREQSLRDVPVSVSTVTSKMIADRLSVTLDDAIRYVPGVNMTADQVNIRGSSGYSRSVGSRILVLIDGLPFLTGDTGEINWETFPMFQIERIEIVKGAGSALYGSSALGGVINVITKDISQSPEIRFKLFSGIYDKPVYSKWDWSSSPRFNSGGYFSYSNRTGSLGYLVSASRTVDESYRENDVYHRWGIYSKLRYDFSQFQDLTLTFNFQWRNHGNYFWWKSLDEPTRPADSQLNGNVDSHRGYASLAYKNVLSDDFFYSLKAIYCSNFWQDDSSGRVNNTSSSHLTQLEAQATYSTSASNVLTFGAAANYDRVISDIFGSHPGISAAIFAQDEFAPFQSLKLTAGVRYDWQRIWREIFTSSTAVSPSQLNPKIGLVYTFDPITTFRASYGEGFRYPSISELFTSISTGVSQISIVPNDSLKPERSTSFEIGASRWLTDNIFLDLALFQSNYYDLIEAGVNPNRFEIIFSNVTRARIRGLETGLKTNWLNRMISADFSYTYIDPVDLSNNSVLRFRPRNLFYVSMTGNYRQLRAEVNFRYMSRVEAIDENLVRLAPIVDGDQRVECSVIDAGINYNLIGIGLPFNIGFTVKNLTNYYYVELIGNLAPLRTYYLSIEGSL